MLGTFVVKFPLPALVFTGLSQRQVSETLVMADSGQSGAGRWHRILAQSLRQLVRNPIILAMVGGIAAALLGMPLS